MMIVVGIVAGILAFKIGKLRHSCAYWARENPAYLSPGWKKPEVRAGSLLLVAVFSIIFATCFSFWLQKEAGDLFGKIAWGALLFLRWIASSAAARISCKKQKQELERLIKPSVMPLDIPRPAIEPTIPSLRGSNGSKDFAVLADQVFTGVTAAFPVVELRGDATFDEAKTNRLYFSAAHAARDLLALCLSIHHAEVWTEANFNCICSKFRERAEREWINNVVLCEVAGPPSEIYELHGLLIASDRSVTTADVMHHRASLGAIYSLLFPVRAASFKRMLDELSYDVRSKGVTVGFYGVDAVPLADKLGVRLYAQIIGELLPYGFQEDDPDVEFCGKTAGFLVGFVARKVNLFLGKE